MISDEELAWLRARLDEDEAAARDVRPDQDYADSAHQERWSPARVLSEVEAWRHIILEYAIPPGTDGVYGGTERETGFRLALSFALKAKIAVYDGTSRPAGVPSPVEFPHGSGEQEQQAAGQAREHGGTPG